MLGTWGGPSSAEDFVRVSRSNPRRNQGFVQSGAPPCIPPSERWGLHPKNQEKAARKADMRLCSGWQGGAG